MLSRMLTWLLMRWIRGIMWFNRPSTSVRSLSKGIFNRLDMAEIRENVTASACTGSTSAFPPAILLVKSNIFAIMRMCSSETSRPIISSSRFPKRPKASRLKSGATVMSRG